MVLTKRVGKPPRVIAEALVRALAGDPVVKSADVAGPGFVNLRLHPSAFRTEVEEVLLAGRGYGRAPAATGERINIEFVSANPTGPLHVGHARGAVFGDTLARLLEATGNRVAREYYINDFGNQTRVFAESVLAAAEGRPTPEGGYGGAYVAELARWLQKVDPAALEADRETLAPDLHHLGVPRHPGIETLRGIKQTLRDLRRLLRRLVQRGVSPPLGARGGRTPSARGERPPGAQGRRALLRRLRRGGRRQGPRRPEERRRLHVLRLRHRLLRRQDCARLRPPAHRPRRRPPRLRRRGCATRIEALGPPGSTRFEALLYQLVFIYRRRRSP